jgi:hypothetical protein
LAAATPSSTPTSGVIPNDPYLVGGTHLHPGDSVDTLPPEPVDVLSLPTAAPWQKLADVVGTCARTLRAPHTRPEKPALPGPIREIWQDEEGRGVSQTRVRSVTVGPASASRCRPPTLVRRSRR